MKKTRNILLAKPLVNESCKCSLEEIFSLISGLPVSERLVSFGDSKNILLTVKKEAGFWKSELQSLRNDELPKVANYEDGGDEIELNIPDGKALSYRNVFMYDPAKNILGYTKIPNCPQNNSLRKCIEHIAGQRGVKVKLRFQLLFNNDLAKKLRNAKTITTAQFTSLDWDGTSIGEGVVAKYKDYLGGIDYEKVTILRGKKGANIKSVVQSLIDDYLSLDEGEMPFSVKMKIDDENIDFSNYYEKFPMEVEQDNGNQKYVDYRSLADAIKDVMDSYGEGDIVC